MITPGRPEDCLDLARVHVGSWRAGYRGLMPDEHLDGLSVDERALQWRRRMQDSDAPSVWIDRDQGAAAGFVCFGPAGDEDLRGWGQVYGLHYLPAFWGTGRAAQLWSAIIEQMRREAASGVFLWSLEGNARALAFYRRQGLRHDGRGQDARFGGRVLRLIRLVGRVDVRPA